MNDPQSKDEIVARLEHIRQGVHQTLASLTDDQFRTAGPEAWSAEGYLKHLLLSIKPLAKALHFPSVQLRARFGSSHQPSRCYSDVVAAYQARLNAGIRAEDYENVVPNFYRFPEGIGDTRVYLTDAWDESNRKLIAGTANYSEDDLDTLQLPHPALGVITLREILFFTIFHNHLHWNDIQLAGGS